MRTNCTFSSMQATVDTGADSVGDAEDNNSSVANSNNNSAAH